MGKIGKALFVILVICIPIFSLISAANLIFRPPDLYKHELRKMMDIEESVVKGHEERLAESFSDFMWGKEKSLGHIISAEKTVDLFGQNEQAAMEKLRRYLNIISIMGVIALISIVLVCILFRSANEKPALRSAYKYSLIVYGMMVAALGVLLELDGGRMVLLHRISSGGLEEGSLLTQIITEVFARDAFLASGAFSALMMAILAYVIWKISKPRRMF